MVVCFALAFEFSAPFDGQVLPCSRLCSFFFSHLVQMEQAISYLNEPQLAAAIIVQRKEEEEAALALSLSAEALSQGPRIEELEGVTIIQQADAAVQRTMRQHQIRLAYVKHGEMAGTSAAEAGSNTRAAAFLTSTHSSNHSRGRFHSGGRAGSGAGMTTVGASHPGAQGLTAAANAAATGTDENAAVGPGDSFATPLPLPIMFATGSSTDHHS